MNPGEKVIAVHAAAIARAAVEAMEHQCTTAPAEHRNALLVMVGTIVIDVLAASLLGNIHSLPEHLRPSDEFLDGCRALRAAKGKGEAA